MNANRDPGDVTPDERHANELILGMKCDGYGREAALHCGLDVNWAPKLRVPCGGDDLRIMIPLHYCNMHRRNFDPSDVISASMKTKIEAAARERRFERPDFEHVRVEWVRIRTPEYKAYLANLFPRARFATRRPTDAERGDIGVLGHDAA